MRRTSQQCRSHANDCMRNNSEGKNPTKCQKPEEGCTFGAGSEIETLALRGSNFALRMGISTAKRYWDSFGIGFSL